MRTRTALVSAAALLVLAICASCGNGGGGGGAGGGVVAPDVNASVTVGLSWTASDAATGYVVHWGTTSGVYEHDEDVQKPAVDAQGTVRVELTVAAAQAGEQRYFFAITSYDAAGESSAFSNELSIDASFLQ